MEMSSIDLDSTTTEKETEISKIVFYMRAYDILATIIASSIILFNGIIVVTTGLILYNGEEPRTTYTFLGNIALADIIVGINLFFSVYYPGEFRTEMVCSVMVGLNVSSSLISVYSIMLIGIDRYLYIIHGLQYQNYLSMTRAWIAILSIWIVAMILSFIPGMGFRNLTGSDIFCWFTVLVPPQLIFTYAVLGIIPLIVISVLYSIILKLALSKIAERRTNLQNVVNEEQTELPNEESKRYSFAKLFRKITCKNKTIQLPPIYNPSKWKAIKIILLTTGCFYCTWLPFFFGSVLLVFCNPSEKPKYCDNLRVVMASPSPLAILGVCNSILNPLIYAWWHNGFRESIKKIYRKLFKRQL